MPRDQVIIAGFTAGVISSPDAQDIPNDAAAYSLDLDPETGPGVVRGRLDDATVTHGALSMRSGALVERDSGEVDLIYYDNSDGKVKSRQDFYNLTPVAPVDVEPLTADERVQITPFAREVRVARSGGDVQWVGYIPDELLGEDGDTETLHVENARLENPAGDGFFDKVLYYGGGADPLAYGLVRGETQLYKINLTSGTRTRFGSFNSLAAMCHGYTAIGGNPVIWILDKEPLVLYYYDLVDETLSSAYALGTLDEVRGNYIPGTGYEVDVTSEVTDICAVSKVGASPAQDRIFIARHVGSRDNPGLYDTINLVVSVDTGGSTPLTVTDRTPYIGGYKAGTPHYGHMYFRSYSQLNGQPQWNRAGLPTGNDGKTTGALYETFPSSLVRLSATSVGFIFRVQPFYRDWISTTSYGMNEMEGPYLYDGSGNYRECGGTICQVLAWDYAGAGAFTGSVIMENKLSGNANIEGVCYDASPIPDVMAWGRSGDINTGTINVHYAAGTIAAPTAGDTWFLEGFLQQSTPLSYGVSDVYNDGANKWLLARRSGYSGICSVARDTVSTAGITELYQGGSATVLPTLRSDGDAFTANTVTFYKISFTYDGVQEGPLSKVAYRCPRGVGDVYNANVKISVIRSYLSRRMTHLNLYRASGATSSSAADGYYRLIKTVPLTQVWFGPAGDDSFSYTFIDNNSENGASYEARTGVSEALDNTFVDYEVATVCNGRLFVARCRHDELPDAMHTIFASKSFRWDSFNWTDDYLRLPEIPTALSSFGGRVYAFSRTQVYRIDPENLIVEDTFPGVGALGDRAVTVTDAGIVFADANGIYFTNGNGVEHIGLAIRDTLEDNAVAWKNATHTRFSPILVYSSLLKQVHCIADFTDGVTGNILSFAFHVPTKRWDIWKLDANTLAVNPKVPRLPVIPSGQSFGAMRGHYGELYFSTAAAMKKIAGSGATRRSWTWWSRKLTMDAPSQRKRIYSLIAGAEGTPDLSISVDGGAEIDMAGGAYSSEPYGREVQIFMEGAGDVIVRNLSLLYRRLAGNR